MTPSDFGQRYVAAIQDGVPAGLLDELSEFTEFEPALVARLRLSQLDAAILMEAGLPRTAPPFLFFGGERVAMGAPLDGAEGKVIIGANGFGDHVCLDLKAGGMVVEVSEDDRSQSRLMNASVMSLAHCLCAFAEFRKLKDGGAAFRQEMATIDPVAAADDSWWTTEIDVRSR